MARLIENQRTMPPSKAILITKSDVTTYDPPLRAITIGTAGDLAVKFVSGDSVVLPANCLAVGVQHVMEITQVLSTGTTAAELVGWTDG